MSIQLLDTILEGFILIAYIIGTIIILNQFKERNKTLKNEVDSLKSLLESQSALIQGMKAIMDGYKAPIELHNKIIEMQKEENDLMIKKAVREIEEKAGEGIGAFKREMNALLGLSAGLIQTH